MRAKLQKLIGTAVLGLALVSQSMSAWAGDVYLYGEVQIGSGIARGTMAGARYSTDSQQYIGCSFENSYAPFVVCSARDKTGQSFLCTSNDARWLAAVEALTDSSYIYVSADPGSTACNYLQVTNSSAYLR